MDKRSIKGYARKYNIPVIFAENLNTYEFIDKLRQFSPLDKVQRSDFIAMPNQYKRTKTFLFPTLLEVKAYRNLLRKRRRGGNYK